MGDWPRLGKRRASFVRWVACRPRGLDRITTQLYIKAVHPPGALPLGLRFQIASLFPELTKQPNGTLLLDALRESTRIRTVYWL